VMEHHANIVPWHLLRERLGIELVWVDVDANGDLDPARVLDAITPKTKLVAVTHLSNVLGTEVDVRAICDGAHAKGVPVLVDGSQAAVHIRRHRPQALRPVRLRRDLLQSRTAG